MYSIIIPTYNNINYLKICIESIKKNSNFANQIIVHVNEGKDGTKDYLESKKIDYTWTNNNVGLCKGVNLAAKKIKTNYVNHILIRDPVKVESRETVQIIAPPYL